MIDRNVRFISIIPGSPVLSFPAIEKGGLKEVETMVSDKGCQLLGVFKVFRQNQWFDQ